MWKSAYDTLSTPSIISMILNGNYNDSRTYFSLSLLLYYYFMHNSFVWQIIHITGHIYKKKLTRIPFHYVLFTLNIVMNTWPFMLFFNKSKLNVCGRYTKLTASIMVPTKCNTHTDNRVTHLIVWRKHYQTLGYKLGFLPLSDNNRIRQYYH